MHGALLVSLCHLSPELNNLLMGGSAEFIFANKEELTTIFFYTCNCSLHLNADLNAFKYQRFFLSFQP